MAKVIMEEGDEKFLEFFLSHNLNLIEEGLELIECQNRISNGIIDILAKDKNNTYCVIELKTKKNDKDLVWQSAYYQSQFEGDVRVITVAPDYSKTIYNALKNIKNTEMKRYKLNEDDFLEITEFEG